MKSKFSLSLLLVCIISSVWSFSLGVYRQGAASDHIVNSHSVSDPLRSLTSIDIADICARVTGNIPLLREESVNLPTSLFAPAASEVSIIEIDNTAILPADVRTVLSSRKADYNIQEISRSLASIDVKTNIIQVNSFTTHALKEVLKGINHPVIVLNNKSIKTLDSTVTPLTEFEISQYQIVLWTGLSVLLITLAAIYSIINMEVIPDSLLMAKFQSARTNKRD